jgi:hypothetical protein
MRVMVPLLREIREGWYSRLTRPDPWQLSRDPADSCRHSDSPLVVSNSKCMRAGKLFTCSAGTLLKHGPRRGPDPPAGIFKLRPLARGPAPGSMPVNVTARRRRPGPLRCRGLGPASSDGATVTRTTTRVQPLHRKPGWYSLRQRGPVGSGLVDPII